jgi:hypothetical protein
LGPFEPAQHRLRVNARQLNIVAQALSGQPVNYVLELPQTSSDRKSWWCSIDALMKHVEVGLGSTQRCAYRVECVQWLSQRRSWPQWRGGYGHGRAWERMPGDTTERWRGFPRREGRILEPSVKLCISGSAGEAP